MRRNISLLFLILITFTQAALPPLSKEHLRKYSDLIATGKVLEITSKKEGDGILFFHSYVRREYTITLEVSKFQKKPSQLTTTQLTVTGYLVEKMKYPGPSGHNGLSELQVGDSVQIYAYTFDDSFKLQEPNGLLILE